jgi:hypothetical protein
LGLELCPPPRASFLSNRLVSFSFLPRLYPVSFPTILPFFKPPSPLLLSFVLAPRPRLRPRRPFGGRGPFSNGILNGILSTDGRFRGPPLRRVVGRARGRRGKALVGASSPACLQARLDRPKRLGTVGRGGATSAGVTAATSAGARRAWASRRASKRLFGRASRRASRQLFGRASRPWAGYLGDLDSQVQRCSDLPASSAAQWSRFLVGRSRKRQGNSG